METKWAGMKFPALSSNMARQYVERNNSILLRSSANVAQIHIQLSDAA